MSKPSSMTRVRPDKPDGLYQLTCARPDRMIIGQQDTAKPVTPDPQSHQTRAHQTRVEVIDLDAVAATIGDYPDLLGLVGAHEHDTPTRCDVGGGRSGLAA